MSYQDNLSFIELFLDFGQSICFPRVLVLGQCRLQPRISSCSGIPFRPLGSSHFGLKVLQNLNFKDYYQYSFLKIIINITLVSSVWATL